MTQRPEMTENITGRRAGMRGIVRVAVVLAVLGIGCGDVSYGSFTGVAVHW